jgi:hypothetical protein
MQNVPVVVTIDKNKWSEKSCKLLRCIQTNKTASGAKTRNTMARVASFIGKLFVMVSENQDCMEWLGNRKTVVVSDLDKLQSIVVNYCSRSNKVKSFVRRLHLHGFKVYQTSATITFQHQLFDSSGKFLSGITTKSTSIKARIEELETQLLLKSDKVEELRLDNNRLQQQNRQLSRELQNAVKMLCDRK